MGNLRKYKCLKCGHIFKTNWSKSRRCPECNTYGPIRMGIWNEPAGGNAKWREQMKERLACQS